MPWQGVPLMYVPLEVVMSKYYGESERLLGKVFSLANELPNGAIIFLDEVTDANMLTFVLSKQFILCFITNIPKWSSQMITFFLFCILRLHFRLILLLLLVIVKCMKLPEEFCPCC